VPYPVGAFRAEWARFPVLIRWFHPDLNSFRTLTQIPPAADVYLLWVCDAGHRFVATPAEQRDRPGRSRRSSTWCPECSAGARGRDVRVPRAERSRPARPVASGSGAPGEAFVSRTAPAPASAAEARLRAGLRERLDLPLDANAVRVRQRFHGRDEVWPDIPIPELRVAIEYDTVGRTGTEHVGDRERSDRAKDQALRGVGWEVVRLRTSGLRPLGPYDLECSGVTGAVVDRVMERLADIRGDLIVAAYSRPPVSR